MSSLKARKANTWRVEHLQRAHFKNYYEMKRFVDEQKTLCRDHRRLMFLINKDIQELQKTLMDVNLISGYFHEAYASHLRSVSIAFSTCKEYKKARKCGNIDFMNLESGNSVQSKCMFSQKYDGLCDETSGDCERDLSEVKQHTLSPEMYKKCSTDTDISPHKDLKNDNDDDFKAILFRFELFSSELNEKDQDESLECLQKNPSNMAKTDLKNSSSTPTHFTLHRRAKQAHQKHPAPGMRIPSHEQDSSSYYLDKRKRDQDSKILSRYTKNKDGVNTCRSCVSKAAIKNGLDLLIKDYNRSQNADVLNNTEQRDLHEKVSSFVSELLEFKCDI